MTSNVNRSSTQWPNIKIPFKFDHSSWDKAGISAVEYTGLTNTLQEKYVSQAATKIV